MKPDISSTSTAQHSKEVSEYKMPPSLDHTKEMKLLGQVSTIKGFLQSCVKILNDPYSFKILQSMLEICSIEIEGKLEQKIINHLHTRIFQHQRFQHGRSHTGSRI
jgi:hypothetical protein